MHENPYIIFFSPEKRLYIKLCTIYACIACGIGHIEGYLMSARRPARIFLKPGKYGTLNGLFTGHSLSLSPGKNQIVNKHI